MSSLTKEILYFEDTYVSSKTRDQNENKFPLLNAGRSENGNLNRALLKADFSSLTGQIVNAKLCLFQVFYGSKSTEEDILYLHEVETLWNEPTATWNSLGEHPIGKLIAQSRFPVEDNIKHCFSVDPSVLHGDGYGFILKGEENLDRHDRWFHSSEYQEDEGPSTNFHPHLELETTINPNHAGYNPPNGSSPGSNKGGGITGLVLGLTTGVLGLALLALLVFVGLRHRRNVQQRRLEEEEYSDEESSEEEKDVVDKLGEVFGVVSSSDDEDDTLYTRDNETMYTRDVDNSVQSDYYTTNEEIEVRNAYTVREKFQNMLFGVREGDETTVTTNEIENYYRNRR